MGKTEPQFTFNQPEESVFTYMENKSKVYPFKTILFYAGIHLNMFTLNQYFSNSNIFLSTLFLSLQIFTHNPDKRNSLQEVVNYLPSYIPTQDKIHNH